MSQPEYLNGYNMVLSISMDALNNQLKHLYNTPVPGGSLPPPGGQGPSRKYLIDRELVLNNNTNSLKANIACPTLSLKNLSSAANVGRTVKMSIDFLAGSSFDYWKEDDTIEDGPPYVKVQRDVSGYGLSFEASLGMANIQQIEEDLLHPDIKGTVTEYIASEDYLVSSLFCLFEDAQIASSLQVTDAKGNPLLIGGDGTGGDDADLAAWVLSLTTYFAKFRGGVTPGANPFILGYGVTQKPQKQLPPALFAPKKFDFSTTGVGGQTPTLNFLLITDDRDVDRRRDPGAGIFDQSLFNVIHSSNQDGVMAVSSRTFADKFIVPEIETNFWYGAPPINGYTISTSNAVDVSNTEWFSKSLDWQSSYRGWSEDLIEWHDVFNGTNKLTVTYSSDNQDNPGSMSAPDAQRRMYINIDGLLTINYLVETTTYPIGTTDWSFAFTAGITVPYKVRLIVSCGADGKWIIQRDDANSSLPRLDANNRLVLIDNENYTYQTHGVFKALSFLGLDSVTGLKDFVGRNIASVANTEWTSLSESMSSELSSLSTKLIMPAGDVFMFDGLNTDSAGHVYSGVKYSTLSALGAQGRVPTVSGNEHIASSPETTARTEEENHALHTLRVYDTIQHHLDQMTRASKGSLVNGLPDPILSNAVKMLQISHRSAAAAVDKASSAAGLTKSQALAQYRVGVGNENDRSKSTPIQHEAQLKQPAQQAAHHDAADPDPDPDPDRKDALADLIKDIAMVDKQLSKGKGSREMANKPVVTRQAFKV